MKKFLAVLVLAVGASLATGCYKSQEGGYKAGVPFAKDSIEGRYERPVEQVYEAAKATLAFNGALSGENTLGKVLTGNVNGRKVWVKVDEVEPRVSRVIVQARRSGGRGDIDLAAELNTQIALRLR
jgi:hypothetical protein